MEKTMENNMNFADRIGYHNQVNPALRWSSSNPVETIRVESLLMPADESLDMELPFESIGDVFGYGCGDWWLEEMLDDEFEETIRLYIINNST